MSENSEVTKAAGVIGFFTIISRILGMVRDMVVANYFGAQFCSDAFFAAFRIPNLLRRLFAEGSLSMSFVPVFSEIIGRKGKDEAFRMARSALKLVSVILTVITLLGIYFSSDIAVVLGYGFDAPEKISLTATLNAIMFPYIFFISIVALFMGILNVLGHFAAPALAPVVLNVVMISSVYISTFLWEDDTRRITALAYGVLIGGGMQVLLQIPFLMKHGFYFWKKSGFYHPALKRIGKLMPPAIFGAAAYQVNILVGIVFASTLAEGSITYLYYADRLVQLPLGIFAISTATALLPSLSKQAAREDFKTMAETFSYSIRHIFFIILPSTAGLVALREPIVRLIFERGAFSYEASQQTSEALLLFALGLWAFSGIRIVISVFNAFSDMRTPAIAAVLSILINFLLCLILMNAMGHGGIALATSMAAIFQILFLTSRLHRKLAGIKWQELGKSIIKSAIASVIMGGIVISLERVVMPEKIYSTAGYLALVVICIFTGILSYALVLYLLKSEELQNILNIIKKDTAE